MKNQKNLAIALCAMLASVGGYAQDLPANKPGTPSAQVAEKETPKKSPGVQSTPAQEKNKVPDVPQTSSFTEKSKEKGDGSGNKFIERPGTGGSKVVRSAPPVKLPEGPTGKAPDVKKAIQEAQMSAGNGLDEYQREINLPGLKKDDPTLKPFVMNTRNGVNEVVKLSGKLLNRIATPFAKPVVIDTSESLSKVVGSDVYYIPAGNSPIGLYIVDQSNTAQTISLTVIPVQDIPGQNIIAKMEDLRTVKNLAAEDSADVEAIQQPKPSEYTGYVRMIMTQAVRGKIVGFTPVPIEGGVAKIGDLEVVPELSFTGAVVDVYRYAISNKGNERIDLTESAFYKKGVKAISFFPRLSLNSGESGYVFLLADKPIAASDKGE